MTETDILYHWALVHCPQPGLRAAVEDNLAYFRREMARNIKRERQEQAA